MIQRPPCGSVACVDVRFSISARTVSNTLPGRGKQGRGCARRIESEARESG